MGFADFDELVLQIFKSQRGIQMNSNTQNTKIKSITEKTLVVGIDVGSETHYARAFDWRNIELSSSPYSFSNSIDGFQAFLSWAKEIAADNSKEEIFTGMEPTGHYWFNLGAFLQEHGIRPLHVNPFHVKNAKELDDNDPSKNDRKDPKVIAGLVNEGRFSYPYIPEGMYAEIRALSTLRLQTQEEVTRIKNRMARWFSIHFPEYKDVYRVWDASSGLMILRVAPLPEDIIKLGMDGVNKIWREAKLRGCGLKRASALVNAAERSVGVKTASEAARVELSVLLEDYERLNSRLHDLEEKIDTVLDEIPYVDRLLEIKGVGRLTVCGFIAEVGDISRFDSPKQLQKLAGLAIVSNSSGKHKGETHISYRGRKRLRYVMFEAAVSVIARNEAFQSLHKYYTTRPKNPLKKMQSLIAIACKLIRVFYTIATKDIRYSSTKMLEDIHRPEEAPATA